VVRSGRPRRYAVVLTVVVLAGVAVMHFTGYLGSGDTTVDRALPLTGTVDTVEVTRQDIRPVVSMPATVVSRPIFHLAAPAEGVIRYDPSVGVQAPSPPGEATGADSQEADQEAVNLAPGATLFRVEAEAVTAPVAAAFVRWLVPDGAVVHAEVPVLELAYVGFGLEGTLPIADAYRFLSGDLSAVGSITGGPTGFECPVLRASPALDNREAAPGVVCALSPEVRAFEGLDALIAVSSVIISGVLTLPTTAVSGSAVTGEVTRLHADGSLVITTVGLGVTDGAVVEITSGLREGDFVAVTPPPLIR
jgi:membrane fusion protein, macrolide-specific efflux system